MWIMCQDSPLCSIMAEHMGVSHQFYRGEVGVQIVNIDVTRAASRLPQMAKMHGVGPH